MVLSSNTYSGWFTNNFPSIDEGPIVQTPILEAGFSLAVFPSLSSSTTYHIFLDYCFVVLELLLRIVSSLDVSCLIVFLVLCAMPNLNDSQRCLIAKASQSSLGTQVRSCPLIDFQRLSIRAVYGARLPSGSRVLRGCSEDRSFTYVQPVYIFIS